MRSAIAPSIDDEGVYNTVRDLHDNLSERAVLDSIRAAVFSDYDDFVVGHDYVTVGDLACLPHSNRVVLHDNYEYLRRSAAAPVRAAVLHSAYGLCTLCGNLNASEVDHWLPRSRFPQYSIFSPNLIPACRRCNGKKGSRVFDSTGRRIFAHPYFDTALSTQFLGVQISVTVAVTVSYEVRWSEAVDGWRHELLTRHFDSLDLNELYSFEAIQYMDEHRSTFYAYFGDEGGPSVERYLRRDARAARGFFGTNHWKPVLLDALADSDEFCEGGFRALGPDDPVAL